MSQEATPTLKTLLEIKKRLRACDKKLQRISDTEKKPYDSLNEDQKVFISSKSLIEKTHRDLSELSKIAIEDEKHIADLLKNSSSSSTATADTSSNSDFTMTKEMFSTLLGFFAAFGLVYKVAHHDFISPYMPSILRQSTGQDVAAMLNLYNSIVKLPVSADDDVISQIRKLTEATNDPIISDVSFKRMNEIVSSTVNAAVSAKKEAEAAAADKQASSQKPNVNAVPPTDPTTDGTVQSLEEATNDAPIPTEADVTTYADAGDYDDLNERGTAVMSTAPSNKPTNGQSRRRRGQNRKKRPQADDLENPSEKVKEWSASLATGTPQVYPLADALPEGMNPKDLKFNNANPNSDSKTNADANTDPKYSAQQKKNTSRTSRKSSHPSKSPAAHSKKRNNGNSDNSNPENRRQTPAKTSNGQGGRRRNQQKRSVNDTPKPTIVVADLSTLKVPAPRKKPAPTPVTSSVPSGAPSKDSSASVAAPANSSQ